MEEDVEIEMLLKSEERLLLEAVNSFDSKNSQLETQAFSSDEVKKSTFNKENVIHNECQGTSSPSTLTPKKIENSEVTYNSNMQPVTRSDNICNFGSCIKNPNSIPNIDSRDSYQTRESSFELSCADDQVNERILELIANDPLKYYWSKQDLYVSQYKEDEESDDNKNIDEIKSSDDDWEDDYGYNDDKFGDDMLEEELSNTSNISNKQVLQKLEMKAVPALSSLGKMLLRRRDYLKNLEIKLLQLYEINKHKRQEFLSLFMDQDKTKPIEGENLKCSYKVFGMPYFCDDVGFHPPPNQDHLQKLKNGEIAVHKIPKIRNWTKEQKELMQNAIKKTLLTEKSEKLTKEITNLTDQLKCKKGHSKKLLEKVTTKQNELRALYKKSFKELVESEKEDREYDWMKFSISLFDGKHSADECRRFWHIYVKPSINKGPWTNSEDKRLLEIANNLKFQDWAKIAKLLGTNRSAFQCFVHFQTRIEGNSDLSNGKWSKVEDKKLKAVVNSAKLGDFIPWSKVSAYVSHRNHNQIYNRWANSLNPELVKGRFTKEEDLLIVTGVEVFGLTCKELAFFLTGRKSCQIRERYQRHLLPKTAKVGPWSLDEDYKLLDLVQEFGEQNWAKIASIMKTRSRTQVRQRYGFIRRMKKKHPDWTVTQVKRRTNKVHLKTLQTEKDVDNLKKIVGNVEKVFNLTGIEKETYVLNKLLELQDKISSKHGKSRGRKKKEEHYTNLPVNDSLKFYFSNCNSYSPSRPMKPSQYNLDKKLNIVILMSKFFGHKIKLPKSEEEVCNNSRLSSDIKCHTLMLLDSNSSDNSKYGYTQQSVLCSKPTFERNSTQSINCEVPDNDNTIIMMDWWHTPPINVANLNFSEFFKRTVFDYSNGMHKDIWSSKVKRSQLVAVGDDIQEHTEDSKPVHIDQLSFPLNHYSTLTRRHTLMAREYFEQYVINNPDNDFIKEEVKDDRLVNEKAINLSSMVKDNLISLLTWPMISTAIKVGSAPMDITSRVQKDLKKYKFSPKNFAFRKRKIMEDYKDDCAMENVHQPEDSVKKRKLDVETNTGTSEKRKLDVERNTGTSERKKLDVETNTGTSEKRKLDVERNTGTSGRKKLDVETNTGTSEKRKLDVETNTGTSEKRKLDVETNTGTSKVKNYKQINMISNSSSRSSKRTLDSEEQNLSPSVKKKLETVTKIVPNKGKIIKEKNIVSNDSLLLNKKINEDGYNFPENISRSGPVSKKRKRKKSEKSNSRKKSKGSHNPDSKMLSCSALNVTTQKLRSSSKKKSRF